MPFEFKRPKNVSQNENVYERKEARDLYSVVCWLMFRGSNISLVKEIDTARWIMIFKEV